MPHPHATIDGEPRRIKRGLWITSTELAALAFIRKIHGTKYDGDASVLRDYSLVDAVELHRNATAKVSA